MLIIDIYDFFSVLENTNKHSYFTFEGNVNEIIKKIKKCNIDINQKYKCILQFTANESLVLQDINKIVDEIQKKMSEDSSLIYGISQNEDQNLKELIIKLVLCY